MIDKSSLLKSQGSLYLEFIPKDGLFHKMLLLSLMGFLTGWCNLEQPVCRCCTAASLAIMVSGLVYYSISLLYNYVVCGHVRYYHIRPGFSIDYSHRTVYVLLHIMYEQHTKVPIKYLKQ